MRRKGKTMRLTKKSILPIAAGIGMAGMAKVFGPYAVQMRAPQRLREGVTTAREWVESALRGGETDEVLPDGTTFAAYYVRLVLSEYDISNSSLGEAKRYRRQGKAASAQRALLWARYRHADEALKLYGMATAQRGQSVTKWLERRKVERQVLRLRHEVLPDRETVPTQPVARVGFFTRIWRVVSGGPRLGICQELVEYHKADKRYYRDAIKRAKRYEQRGDEEQARFALFTVVCYHYERSRRPGDTDHLA